MIPQNRLSTTPTPSAFLLPDDREPPNSFEDYELGGVALQNPSQGLQVKVWTCRANQLTGEVFLEAPEVFSTLLFTAPGLTELSLTFDQNMRPFIAFVQNGQAKYRWYDTVAGENVITNLNVNDYCPRCCLDDKRPWQTTQGDNDVILAYLRAGNLYYRQQRDRYEVERLLYTGLEPQQRLLRVGMNKDRRLQFLIEG